MKSKLCWLSITALVLAGASAWSDEPPKADSREYADLLNRHFFSVLDVSDSLVSANGLGIDVAEPDATLQAQLGLVPGQGVVVTSAPEESMGAKAGLKTHDIITQVDDVQISHADALTIALHGPDGTKVKLHVLRGGKPVNLEATLSRPQVAKVRLRGLLTQGTKELTLVNQETYRIGVSLAEADATLRSQLRLAEGEGLVVTEVIEGSAAAAAGIQANDVLIVLDGKRLTTVEAINSQVQEIKDRQVELRLLRAGKEIASQVAPRKTQEAAFHNRTLRLWDVQGCQKCHAQALDHAQAAHLLLKGKLGAAHSAWTDGHTLKLYRDVLLSGEKKLSGEEKASSSAETQVAALKSQLAEMQKTLAALEASLAAPKPEDQPDEEK